MKHVEDKKGDYVIYFYNNNFGKVSEVTIWAGVKDLGVGFGIFVKGINVKGDYVAFAFLVMGVIM